MRAPPASSFAEIAWWASATNASRTIPRAMPAWLVTTTTTNPARFSTRTASTLYGKKTSRSRRSRYPASSTSVPSRSRNTARVIDYPRGFAPRLVRRSLGEGGTPLHANLRGSLAALVRARSSCELLHDRAEHGVDVNPFHAAMIDGTLAQQARPAEHVTDDHVGAAARRRHALVGRAEDRCQRHAQRRRDVHRARVV